MSGSIYSIGIGALNNAQAGVTTAGNNIANAGTAGYSRQIVDQTSNIPVFAGGSFIGTGASVSAIRRVYDDFLGTQVQQTTSDATALSTYLAQMQQIDDQLGDPTAGLSPALGAFFQAVQAVSSQPSDISARQALLSSAQALTSQFRSLDSQFQNLREATNTSIQASVDHINSLSQQIAALNQRILSLAGSGTDSQQPNDLLDQRDQLILDLNKEIGANVIKAGDGSYGVFLCNGQALVLGGTSYTLKTGIDSEDPSNAQISVSLGSGQLRLRPSDLTGGALGGYLSFRDEGLTQIQNALGRIAMGVAASVNTQHRLGQDLSGRLGADFFTSGAPTVVANANNSGSAAVSATVVDAGALTTSDYRLAYDGTQYTLTRLSDNTASTFSSLPQVVDGLSISVGATAPDAGDNFLIQPTRSGAAGFGLAISDPRSIAAAAPIVTSASLGNTGTGTVSAGTVNQPPPAPSLATLQTPVTITFNDPPTTFNVSGVAGAPSNVPYTAGADISYNGWAIQIDGQPAAGDVFSVSGNAGGAGDNRNAQLLAALQTQTLVGGTSFNGAYAQLVSQVGSKTSELQVTSEAQNNLAKGAQTARNSVSGVNLDEEAASLIQYQQAYQAAGKMIGIANTMFDTILNIKS